MGAAFVWQWQVATCRYLQFIYFFCQIRNFIFGIGVFLGFSSIIANSIITFSDGHSVRCVRSLATRRVYHVTFWECFPMFLFVRLWLYSCSYCLTIQNKILRMQYFCVDKNIFQNCIKKANPHRRLAKAYVVFENYFFDWNCCNSDISVCESNAFISSNFFWTTVLLAFSWTAIFIWKG